MSSVRGEVGRTSNEEFEQLALPLLEPLYNFARWLSGNSDEAKDLVQETFAKALKGFGGFQPGTNFRAWIFRILHNTFLTSRTGLERQQTGHDADNAIEEMPSTRDTPELLLIRRADTELVQAAISSLPLLFQEVILLADIEEMKYREVAETLGIPIGTVMSRLARARKQIRKHILETLHKKS